MEDRNESKRQDFEKVLRTDENIVDGNRRWLGDILIFLIFLHCEYSDNLDILISWKETKDDCKSSRYNLPDQQSVSRAIIDTVNKFFSSNANRKMLREAIYDLKLVKLVLPDVS